MGIALNCFTRHAYLAVRSRPTASPAGQIQVERSRPTYSLATNIPHRGSAPGSGRGRGRPCESRCRSQTRRQRSSVSAQVAVADRLHAPKLKAAAEESAAPDCSRPNGARTFIRSSRSRSIFLGRDLAIDIQPRPHSSRFEPPAGVCLQGHRARQSDARLPRQNRQLGDVRRDGCMRSLWAASAAGNIISSGNAAARTNRFCVSSSGNGECRFAVFLGQLACHQANDAGGPVNALDPQQRFVLAGPAPPVAARPP